MTPLISAVTWFLSVGTVVMQFLALILLVSLTLKKSDITEKKGLGAFLVFVSNYVLEIGFVISLGAMLSSLFYSNVAGYAPCEFCWWARVLIYPQVVLFAVAIYYKRKGIRDSIATTTSLILSIVGFCLNAFQYYGTHFNSSLLEACVAQGVSCSKQYFLSFGYIDIPMMSLACFALLIMLIITHKRVVKLQ